MHYSKTIDLIHENQTPFYCQLSLNYFLTVKGREGGGNGEKRRNNGAQKDMSLNCLALKVGGWPID